MKQPIIHVDAFTNQAFGGNPAAICVLSEARDERWMQNVAGEMNLSETAFLLRGDNGFGLRWFTPTVEVELCGHATLASAHVLWEEGYLQSNEQARFHTQSGLLTARLNGSWIELNFPAREVTPIDVPSGLLEALGIANATFVGWSGSNYLVEVASEAQVHSLAPDFVQLTRFAAQCVIVTSRAITTGYDFVSRVFGPNVGINEDPVTGSAHCSLAPYWGERLGKERMVGYQASARGGIVRVQIQGERILLAGQAVTILRGELV